MASSRQNYEVLEKMERDFERSKAVLMARFLNDQEELTIRLKNMGLNRRHTTNISNIDDIIETESDTRWTSRRREGLSRPRTAMDHRSRRDKVRKEAVTAEGDFSHVTDTDKLNDMDAIEAMTLQSTTRSKRIRPKTSVGFYEKTSKCFDNTTDSDCESDLSNASITSVAGGDTRTDFETLEEQLEYEDYDDNVDCGLEHTDNNVRWPEEGDPFQPCCHHQQQQLSRRQMTEKMKNYPKRENSVTDAYIEANRVAYRSPSAAALHQDKFIPKSQRLHKRKGNSLGTAASSMCSDPSKPLISIHNRPTDAAKLGLSCATRVECDANLYKKLRNKSAPSLRHPVSDKLGKRKPISVYHLPPLDKELVGDRASGSTTPAGTAAFHGPAPYIEANLK